MMSRKAVAKSTIALLLSVIGVSLLTLVVSSSAAAGVAEAELRVAPPLHPVTRSNVDAPQAASVLTDTTVADFQAGLRPCYAAPSAGSDFDGELILTPTIGVTFTGTVLPSDWYTGTYDPAGVVTISNGLLTAKGAYAATSATYAPSQTLEFSATFGVAQGQHVGLTTSPDLSGGSWAIFSTGPSDNLYARTTNVGASEDTALGSQYLGTAHRYQIAWTDTSVTYSIDGNVVAVNNTAPIAAPMRPIVSNAGSAALAVDWLRMSPYRLSSCTFWSRVLDAGESVTWLDLNAIVKQPAGTGIGIFQTRTGMTSTIDGSWSSFKAVTGSTITSPKARYIEYRVTLTTTTTTTNRPQTPVVERVTLSYTSLTAQSIDFQPLSDKIYGDPSFTVVATATSGLSVNFTASGTCNSSGPNGATVTLTGAGSCTVTAHQAGNTTYAPAPDVARSFNIAKANQTITVVNPAPANAANGVSFTVTATASSGLAVAYSASGACTNVGGTFTMTSGTGTCTVHYDQAGNVTYSPAPQVTQTVTAQKANQTITFSPLPDKIIGDPPFTVAATATSGLTVTFTVSGDCSVVGSTITLIRAGSCTVTAHQAGNTNYEPAPNVARTFVIQGIKLYLPLIARNVS